MLRIQKNSAFYNEWLKRRNRKLKKIKARKKEYRKRAITRRIHRNQAVKTHENYDVRKKSISFVAPKCFSLIKNYEETVLYFNSLINFLTNRKNFGQRIYIDTAKVEELTIDALMYLLAIMNNLSSEYEGRYHFSGNAPVKEDVRKLFVESGFYNFVRRNGKDAIASNHDNLQIVTGNNADPVIAKQIIDFVVSKSKLAIRNYSFIFDMMIELMSNTFKHAYKDSVLTPVWYCFAHYDGNDRISFIFMDMGAGIPVTVRRNFFERIDYFKLNKSESDYVISALKGDFRTETKKHNHGKGLPEIRAYCMDGVAKNMHIISNSANVRILKRECLGEDLNVPMTGTLYSWDVCL